MSFRSNATFSGDAVPPNPEGNEKLALIADLQDYGAMIVSELDKAEADLDDTDNQPFSGMSDDIMRDIGHLRNRQFDMFRRHVEIEQSYKIHNSVSDGNDIGRMTFSGIATTMRKKESSTAGLLNRLADFDNQLRAVMDKFETPNAAAAAASSSTAGPSVTTQLSAATAASVATEDSPPPLATDMSYPPSRPVPPLALKQLSQPPLPPPPTPF